MLLATGFLQKTAAGQLALKLREDNMLVKVKGAVASGSGNKGGGEVTVLCTLFL